MANPLIKTYSKDQYYKPTFLNIIKFMLYKLSLSANIKNNVFKEPAVWSGYIVATNLLEKRPLSSIDLIHT